MKNYSLFLLVSSILSFGSYAQQNNDAPIVLYYHVVEKTNSPSGTRLTLYDVSDLRLVEKYDLGANNSRVVTPVYKQIRVKPKTREKEKQNTTQIIEQPKAETQKPTPAENPVKTIATTPAKKDGYIVVDIASTYERILDKGDYESIEMLKKVANKRYFKGDLVEAAKWYSQLFALTTNFEPVYYYRYAQSLRSVDRNEKADAMMKVFENKIRAKN